MSGDRVAVAFLTADAGRAGGGRDDARLVLGIEGTNKRSHAEL
jgi:hypothetical protein